jgi:hypothetical protein
MHTSNANNVHPFLDLQGAKGGRGCVATCGRTLGTETNSAPRDKVTEHSWPEPAICGMARSMARQMHLRARLVRQVQASHALVPQQAPEYGESSWHGVRVDQDATSEVVQA